MAGKSGGSSVEFLDRQDEIPLNKTALRKIALAALEFGQCDKKVNVAFVSDAEIRGLKKRFF